MELSEKEARLLLKDEVFLKKMYAMSSAISEFELCEGIVFTVKKENNEYKPEVLECLFAETNGMNGFMKKYDPGYYFLVKGSPSKIEENAVECEITYLFYDEIMKNNAINKIAQKNKKLVEMLAKILKINLK